MNLREDGHVQTISSLTKHKLVTVWKYQQNATVFPELPPSLPRCFLLLQCDNDMWLRKTIPSPAAYHHDPTPNSHTALGNGGTWKIWLISATDFDGNLVGGPQSAGTFDRGQLSSRASGLCSSCSLSVNSLFYCHAADILCWRFGISLSLISFFFFPHVSPAGASTGILHHMSSASPGSESSNFQAISQSALHHPIKRHPS